MLSAVVDAQNVLLFTETLLDFFSDTVSIVNVMFSVERLSLCFHYTKLNLHLKQYVPAVVTQSQSCHLPPSKLAHDLIVPSVADLQSVIFI
jgi:hypothetical protein